MSTDPRPLLTKVRLIIEVANREARDMTPIECERCDQFLDAAEALARLQGSDALRIVRSGAVHP